MATVTLGTNSTAGELACTSTENQCTLDVPAGGVVCIKNKSTSAVEVKINLETVHGTNAAGTSDYATLEVGDARYYRPNKRNPILKHKTASSTATLAVDVCVLRNVAE